MEFILNFETGKEVAEIHNKVCFDNVEYLGDNIWKVIDHD
jgi:hypothetical protein